MKVMDMKYLVAKITLKIIENENDKMILIQ